MNDHERWRGMPDQELAARAANPSSPGERQAALEAIYERYSSEVLSLCSWWLGDPDPATDAAQSVFEIAFGHLIGGGPADAVLREPGGSAHGCAGSLPTGAARNGRGAAAQPGLLARNPATVRASLLRPTRRMPSTRSPRAGTARRRSTGCSMPSRPASLSASS